jgi:hypothetical protein
MGADETDPTPRETRDASDPGDGGDGGSFRAQFATAERRTELAATILMSIAIVLSAFCAWQATRWGGVQATSFAEASTARIESGKAQGSAYQELAYDASTLLQLALAFSRGETETVSTLSDSFIRDEFKPYVDEWVALDPLQNPDAPATPFDLPGFENAALVEAAEFEEVASAKFEEAKDANQTGDDYILATVYFAAVLFFAGVSTKLDQILLRWTILAVATAGLVFGISRIVTLPFY